MTYDEAFSEAVLGARVTSYTLGNGSYVDYNFNGLRLNDSGGRTSAFSPSSQDRSAVWSIVDIEPPTRPITKTYKRDKWGRSQ